MYVTSGVHTHEKTRIRQHTSAYVSIRLTLPRSEQRSVVKSEGSISIRFCTRYTEVPRNLQHTSAYVSQHTYTSAHVSIIDTPRCHGTCSIRQHTSAHVSIIDTPRCHGTCSARQHTSAHVSAHIGRGACVCAPALDVYGGVRVDEVCYVRYVYARLNALSNADPQVSVLVLLYW